MREVISRCSETKIAPDSVSPTSRTASPELQTVSRPKRLGDSISSQNAIGSRLCGPSTRLTVTPSYASGPAHRSRHERASSKAHIKAWNPPILCSQRLACRVLAHLDEELVCCALSQGLGFATSLPCLPGTAKMRGRQILRSATPVEPDGRTNGYQKDAQRTSYHLPLAEPCSWQAWHCVQLLTSSDRLWWLRRRRSEHPLISL